MTHPVTVIGAGPAGCAASIAARLRGAPVTLFEKSKFPRHKVCGEFLSPEIVPLLSGLGVWDTILEMRPAVYTTLELLFQSSNGGVRHKRVQFADRPYGFSRYHLDRVLLDRALALGADLRAEQATPDSASPPLIMAHGRRPTGEAAHRSADRLFGFKAHFTGENAAPNTVALFFFPGGYLGINPIENQRTNVCGLAREDVLRASRFDIDAFLAKFDVIQKRLARLQREAAWMHAAPLVLGKRLGGAARPGIYPAGDSLNFIDPFTGSGILSAILSGSMAGQAAAEGRDSTEYLRACQAQLAPALRFAKLFRSAIFSGWGASLARWVPGRFLVAATRPRVAHIVSA